MSASLFVLRAILLFLSPESIFLYFRRRYSAVQIGILNDALKVRCKLISEVINLLLLRQCSALGVAPKGIQTRVRKAKVYHSWNIEKAFLKDEIGKCENNLDRLRKKFTAQLRQTQVFLSTCDYIRFARFVADCDVKQRRKGAQRNQTNLALLKKKRFGSFSVSHETIINLSDVELTNIQKDILCRGPHFGVPLRTKGEPISCEFELLYRNLLEFSPQSKDAATQCRSSLEALAHEYANKRDDIRSFSLGREHMKTLRDLRKNHELVISRPDKGRATVVMNRKDYVNKMMSILKDTTKFKTLGPVATHDRTSTIETSLNKFPF